MLAIDGTAALMSPAPEKRVKDRAATEKAIFAAAKSLLAEEGFQGFGINAVARRAGCDKQLIYRYFGGLEGLVSAIGEDLASWVQERIPQDTGGMFLLTYGDLMERLMLSYLDALRADPLVCKIIAWEVSEQTPQVTQLADARSKALARWIDRMRGSLQPPKGVDPAVMNAMLFASIQHLVIAGTTNGQFSGVSLKGDKDWDKIATAVKRVVRALYG
ncbi:AcrR family transcriptional regulator [Agrobacterium larrymoorei]|uniref:AcrR family transcriptional regulator n=1 Tax=Agrobacterium larrymoorei TaxID=160699 RepID=A0AAJ2ET18_9HYPH|nr:TetR/AcrR family transcriptional regulator [Agrobacterium larrymoorei]MDR6102068.1 AcrR family transcriptional regulator [Agrobacterium larrymoorei]